MDGKITIQGNPENGINANASQSFFKFHLERDGEGGGTFECFRFGGVEKMAEILEIMINFDQVFSDAFFLVASQNHPKKVGELVEEKKFNGTLQYDI